MQDGQRIGFVVVTRTVAALSDRRNHLVLAGVAFAGRVLLDRPHRHALVWDAVVLAPCREVAHEAAVGVRGIHARMPTDFLEVHRVDVVARGEQLRQPALEPQEAHATAFEALRLELFGATRDRSVQVQQCPTGTGAQIEGQDRRIHLLLHFWGE